MILVVFATEQEAGPFLEGASWEREEIGNRPMFRRRADAPAVSRRSTPPSTAAGRPATGWEGREEEKTIGVLICGMGQVNAAQALTAYLERRAKPDLIIMGGCAGAFRGGSAVAGDVCFATEEIYADTGINSPEGFRGLEKTGIPLSEAEGAKYYNRFPVHDLSGRVAGEGFTFKIFSGPFATVSAVSGTEMSAAGIEKTWRPLCENMEGAAAAHVSLLYKAPFAEVRGISNMAEDRDRARWDIPKACANCAAVIKELMEKI